ncbi:hypothetical protein TNCV_4328791 [Trichonephila clavipes]|nr:hypothetical protein TNCV_4328791 [Trichonephila clavipes]
MPQWQGIKWQPITSLTFFMEERSRENGGQEKYVYFAVLVRRCVQFVVGHYPNYKGHQVPSRWKESVTELKASSTYHHHGGITFLHRTTKERFLPEYDPVLFPRSLFFRSAPSHKV